MRCYCIIGARGGSKSIKNKNIVQINKKSLLTYAVDKALKSKVFSKIFISSDNIDYLKYIPKNKNVEFILRPDDISDDTSTEIEYISHVIKIKNLNKNDLIARMQCTSPFQSIQSIRRCVNFLSNLKNKELDSIQLISESSPSIYKSLILSDQNLLSPSTKYGTVGPSNRQSLNKTYFRSNFYVTRIINIINGNIMGDKSYGMICEEREKMDIDSQFDLDVSKAIVKIYPDWLIK